MCPPEWRRALVEAERLLDLARLRRIRDRIDQEHAHPLDVEALALSERMSAEHLCVEFRRAYGRSPYDYQMRRRDDREVLKRGCLRPPRMWPQA